MKILIPVILLAALSGTAHAHPGGHLLVCKSAIDSGSKEAVEISLRRSNGTGWFAPQIDIKIDAKQFRLTTPKENSNYGVTFHNSPLHVITIDAEVPFMSNKKNSGYFSVIAMPNTVKAFDYNNNPVEWSLEAEKEECNDTNGRATFKAIFHGYFHNFSEEVRPEIQVLDCELTYDSGMSC